MSNKDLLTGQRRYIQDIIEYTARYIQYLVAVYNGKESEKEYTYTYICITNHFAVYLKLGQHCTLTVFQLF